MSEEQFLKEDELRRAVMAVAVNHSMAMNVSVETAEKLVNTFSMVGSIMPFVDPTAYMAQGADNTLNEQCARAFLEYRRELGRIAAKHE